MPTWRGNTYRFTVTAATAAAGDTYTNNGQTFTVTDAITAGTVLFCTGTGAPTASGNLVRVTGAGTNPIVFSAVTAPNTNWGTSTNWLTDGSGAGVPTQATNATFDNVSQNCTVNVAAVCRNLNFNSGTGYTGTITMSNTITVGSTSATNHAVTLSAGVNVTGASNLNTRSNGITTLTSNGGTWAGTLGINNIQTAVTSSAVLVGNWTVQNLILAGSNVQLTVSGAFNINVLGNLTVGTTNSVRATTGSIATVVLAGTGTWSSTNVSIALGLNVSINTAGTITIADGVGYGGLATVTGSNMTYVTGTVTCLGTFHLLFAQSGTTYSVNLNGSPSTTATTTSSTGVNFNNLSLTTSSIAAPQIMDIVGNICVVNDFIANGSLAGNKRVVIIRGGTIYCNKGFTNNASFGFATTLTTIIFQGSGTITEANTLTSLSWGLCANMIINTTGTYTIASIFGIIRSSITYTAGSVITTGQGLRVNASSITGFGSGGILLPYLYVNTSTATAVSAAIILTDTVALSVTNMIFDGFNSNNTFAFLGNIGFIANNFTFQQTSITLTSGLSLPNGVSYAVINSFIFTAWTSLNNSNRMSTINSLSPAAVFTLSPGASQDVFGMGARFIDSSAGQTVWSRKGLITATQNWDNWTYPKTRFSSFTS